MISFGTHTIHIVRFEPEGVSSREGNAHVPVWNRAKYTDRVEIRAGWKTPFIRLWAEAFYAHRQRKWNHMLKEENAG